MSQYQIIIKTIATLIAGLIAAGCVNERISVEDFTNQYIDAALVVGDKTIIKQNEDIYQYGFNRAAMVFSMTDDNLETWYQLECNELPTDKGQNIKATLYWSNGDKTERFKNLSLEVVKSENGYQWLWNEKQSVGIVVRFLN